MSDLGQAITFASRLYGQRAGLAWRGHVRRELMALLKLRPGRVNPYAIYDRMRERGTLELDHLGDWVTTSHRVCGSVLRDRRFGAGLGLAWRRATRSSKGNGTCPFSS